MYDLSIKHTSDDSQLTANGLRRVWETFVQFDLGEDVTNIFTSKKITKYLEAKHSDCLNFWKAFAARSFIHSDSHSEAQVKFDNMLLSPALGENDFRRFVREILCFIHIMAPNHITGRLTTNDRDAAQMREELDRLVEDTIQAYYGN
ncbi:hypothetical protein [Arcanobacterium phocae]|uniref:hypothetical protein n=1 Tax=Arcanobacterium phocae TaxID=131112 RepID=UPI001C0FB83F|nr:hypothetical protein [Arcanobacterium phocae]